MSRTHTCALAPAHAPEGRPLWSSLILGRDPARPSTRELGTNFRDAMAVVPPIGFHNMEEIGRKHPVHQPVYERRDVPIIVYLTVCTKRRKPILATPAVHELLRASWQEARL